MILKNFQSYMSNILCNPTHITKLQSLLSQTRKMRLRGPERHPGLHCLSVAQPGFVFGISWYQENLRFASLLDILLAASDWSKQVCLQFRNLVILIFAFHLFLAVSGEQILEKAHAKHFGFHQNGSVLSFVKVLTKETDSFFQ